MLRGTSKRTRRRVLAITALLGTAAVVAVAYFYYFRSGPNGSPDRSRKRLLLVMQVCAKCHQQPKPELLDRFRWKQSLQSMQTLLENTSDLEADISDSDWELVYEYYLEQAPRKIPLRPPDATASPVPFEAVAFGRPPGEHERSIITNLEIVDLDLDGQPEVLVSDASADQLTQIRRNADGQWEESVIAEVAAPARAEAVDFDDDGDLDIVVAALGTPFPTRRPRGKVVMLENDGAGKFAKTVLLENVARVADVRVADLDGDGDRDIAFGAFGTYTIGQVGWLENTGDRAFEHHLVLKKNGITHAPVSDLDGDGDQDIVGVVAQQHEMVVLLENSGTGFLDAKQLFRAGHPLFGMSNVAVVDLDADGDDDIVFTNGDALGTVRIPQPWHAVHWLENRGELAFEHHLIAKFYGAYSVEPVDLDRDGDTDLVVTSMMNDWVDPKRPSIVWLDNDGRQRFRTRWIAARPTFLVTSAVGDLDGDGDDDIVAGVMSVLEDHPAGGRITLYRNDSGGNSPSP